MNSTDIGKELQRFANGSINRKTPFGDGVDCAL
jgi:hypothetical protein